MPNAAGGPVQNCPIEKEEKAKQEPEQHWIKFKVVDDTGKAMPGIVLTVTLPDGSAEERTSDANGLVEIKNIDPGNCKIVSNWKKYLVDETVFIQ